MQDFILDWKLPCWKTHAIKTADWYSCGVGFWSVISMLYECYSLFGEMELNQRFYFWYSHNFIYCLFQHHYVMVWILTVNPRLCTQLNDIRPPESLATLPQHQKYHPQEIWWKIQRHFPRGLWKVSPGGWFQWTQYLFSPKITILAYHDILHGFQPLLYSRRVDFC